jgi:radical SAM protein with 4Fe4S-binding SPASM domain
MLGKKYKPYSTIVELTLQCNMKCIHCGSSAGHTREKELSYAEWITVFKEVSTLDCKILTFIGGEPFLRKDWYELAEIAQDLGMKIIFISNGLLITNKLIAQLRKLEPYTIAISIDGGTAHTHDAIRKVNGSFMKCKTALNLLNVAGIPTSVITTVHKRNFTELPQIRDLLVNKNVAWQIQMADPIGRFPKQLHLSREEFYSVALFIAATRHHFSLKELAVTGAHCIGYNSQVLPNITLSPTWNGCQAGISVLGVQSNGGVKGCLSLPDTFVEGNVRERSLSELWHDPWFCSYNRQFTVQDLQGACHGCTYGKKCRGGCNAVSASLTGNLHADPFCLYVIEQQAVE